VKTKYPSRCANTKRGGVEEVLIYFTPIIPQKGYSTMNIGQSCYLLTHRDVLMPATFEGYDAKGLAEVSSPCGRVYTCNPANVFDAETGRIMLFHRRAEQLAKAGYSIKVRNDGTYRVVNVKKHGEQGGYIVSPNELGLTCTCPACEKDGICKHVMGVTVLLWEKAANADKQNWQAGFTRYSNLARNAA